MYPKVKVREEKPDDQHAYDKSSLQAFDFPFPVKKYEDESTLSVVRIPPSCISKSSMPMAPVFKGSAKSINKEEVEEEKPNIRASSIPRPRAVLSSPDNDGNIRSKNKTKANLISGLKNHNLCQNRHIQCKIVPRSIVAESPPNTRRKSNEAAPCKKNLEEMKGPAMDDPSKRASYIRRGKSRSDQT